jgi:ParB/RepB/Spo0J family partition protein
MKAVEEEETIVWIPVKNIHPNKYNPNAMTEEQDAQLLEDMRLHGPNAIAPLDVRTDLAHDGFPHPIEEVQFEIIDGEHRWNHAVALGWEKIRCVVKDMTLAEAKAANYRKNRERGTVDPFKEAELFKSESDEGLTQEQIAKKYGVDRSQVSKRISLLNITPEIRERVRNVTGVTTSHFEPIATMSPELQIQLPEKLKEYGFDQRSREPATVEDISDIVRHIKNEDKEKREFEKAVSEAKFPKCPNCSGPPVRAHYMGLPMVQCEKSHGWNLKTGKKYGYDWEEESGPAQGDRQKTERKRFEGILRSKHTNEEFSYVLSEFARSLVGEFTTIDEITVGGTTRNGEATLRFYDTAVWTSIGGDNVPGLVEISVEPKTYKSESLKEFRTAIRGSPEPENEKQLRKLSEQVEDLFTRFGKKRRTRKAKKRAKRKQ